MGVIVDILVIGLGVIGTIYAYLFSKEGHNVEHLIRETSKNYSINSLDVELLDGRSDSKGIEMTDTYTVNKSSKNDYDFYLSYKRHCSKGNNKTEIENTNKH